MYFADINECDIGTDDCPENTDCLNIPGSYQCVCKNGFQNVKHNDLLMEEEQGEPDKDKHHKNHETLQPHETTCLCGNSSDEKSDENTNKAKPVTNNENMNHPQCQGNVSSIGDNMFIS